MRGGFLLEGEGLSRTYSIASEPAGSRKTGILDKRPMQKEMWLRKAKGGGVKSLALIWKRRYFRFGNLSVAWMADEKPEKALSEALYQAIEGVVIDKLDGELVLQIETESKKMFVTTKEKGNLKNNKAVQDLLLWGTLLQRWISWSTKKPMEIPLFALTARESICVLLSHPGRAYGWLKKSKKGKQAAKGTWKKRYVRVGEKSIGWFENEAQPTVLGDLPFSLINSVKIEDGLLVVKSIKKNFYFQKHEHGETMEAWRVVFLRCLSYGRGAPLVGAFEDALPSANKEKLRQYDAGELSPHSAAGTKPVMNGPPIPVNIPVARSSKPNIDSSDCSNNDSSSESSEEDEMVLIRVKVMDENASASVLRTLIPSDSSSLTIRSNLCARLNLPVHQWLLTFGDDPDQVVAKDMAARDLRLEKDLWLTEKPEVEEKDVSVQIWLSSDDSDTYNVSNLLTIDQLTTLVCMDVGVITQDYALVVEDSSNTLDPTLLVAELNGSLILRKKAARRPSHRRRNSVDSPSVTRRQATKQIKKKKERHLQRKNPALSKFDLSYSLDSSLALSHPPNRIKSKNSSKKPRKGPRGRESAQEEQEDEVSCLPGPDDESYPQPKKAVLRAQGSFRFVANEPDVEAPRSPRGTAGTCTGTVNSPRRGTGARRPPPEIEAPRSPRDMLSPRSPRGSSNSPRRGTGARRPPPEIEAPRSPRDLLSPRTPRGSPRPRNVYSPRRNTEPDMEAPRSPRENKSPRSPRGSPRPDVSNSLRRNTDPYWRNKSPRRPPPDVEAPLSPRDTEPPRPPRDSPPPAHKPLPSPRRNTGPGPL